MRGLVAITLAVSVCVSRVFPHVEDSAARLVQGVAKLTAREAAEKVFQAYQVADLLKADQK